jgi:signal transduction histidine kinase
MLTTCPVHQISVTGKPVKALQRFIRADGTSLEVEVFAAPMRAGGEFQQRTFIVEAIRDLQKEVDFSLEQKLATMAQVATGVAHEIRNPLASIRLALQSGLRSAERGGDVDQIIKYLKHVDSQIDNCIEVTERLFKLSEPRSDQLQLVSLNTATEETISLVAHEGAQRGVNIQLELDPADVRVMSTDSEIRMVVLNLVQNAFHAMPDGGSLRIITRTNRELAELVVADTGTGISVEDLPHIFEPFFSHRADGVKGTGLGLAICRSIVTRYNGRIDVDTTVGKGTSFTVTLRDAEMNV